MPEHNSVGMIQTVNGLVPPDRLGPTLTHEHLLIDLSWFRTEPAEASGKAFIRRPMSQEMLGYVRHHNMANYDNGQLFDVETAIDEVNLYKQYGGGSIVDATSIGIARDPVGLARIARATGVNVIMGASHYVAPAHPADMDDRSEDSIFGKIVEDVTEGVDGTGIRSGIIGEVGCSWPLTDNERKVLRASGRAQLATGAPLLIHPGRDETAPLEIIEVLSEVGTDLSRTIIGHLDRTVFLHETLKSIAESGCYMEWDLFGSEQSYYSANTGIDMPGDARKMDDIAWVLSQGYGDKVVVAHDICAKQRLVRYGGHGYFYILHSIVPRMRARGYTDEAIEKILVSNPASILAFVDPR